MNTTLRRTDEQRGAVAVIVAIVATLLIACMAFAIDIGYAWQVRRSMVKATDAAALAAARSQSQLTSPTTGDCTAGVEQTATAYLDANASDSLMDFCVATAPGGGGDDGDGDDDSGATPTLGTVTVRGAAQAEFSFAKLFGLDSTTVHSSTTVAWTQAPLLPLMACISTNAEPSQWFADTSPDRAPVKVDQQWSGSPSADPCSSGKSDSYALVDFATVPSSTSDARACTTQPSTLPASLVGWLTNGYGGTISVGSYRCARVGQPYGTAVDRAICALRGRQAVVPLIDVVDKQEVPGDGKADLVRIAGFATVSIDDYTPLNGSNQCDAQFPAASGPRTAARVDARPIVARRPAAHPRIRPAATGPSASLTMQLNNTAPTATVTAGSLVFGTINIANSGTAAWSGTATLTFGTPVPSSVTFSGTSASKCTWVSPRITCTGLSLGASGSLSLLYGATWTATGSGRVTGTIGSSAAEKDYVDYTVLAGTTTTTAPTPPTKSVAVTIAGAGSGKVVATAAGQATQTCTTGTCTWSYPKNTKVTLTETPNTGSLFAGWSGDGTCSGSAITCKVVIPAAKSLAVTATFGIVPTTTTTTIDPLTFRILTMTFQDSVRTGNCCNGLDHVYSFSICDVDLATRAEALNPPYCTSSKGGEDDEEDRSDERSAALGRDTTAGPAGTRLIAVDRPITRSSRPRPPHSPTTGRNPK